MNKQYHRDYYYQNKEKMNAMRLKRYYKTKFGLEDDNKIEFYKKHRGLIKKLRALEIEDLEQMIWFAKDWKPPVEMIEK